MKCTLDGLSQRVLNDVRVDVDLCEDDGSLDRRLLVTLTREGIVLDVTDGSEGLATKAMTYEEWAAFVQA